MVSVYAEGLRLCGKSSSKEEHDSVHALLADLKACSSSRDLRWGKRIHSKAVGSGIESNLYVVTALIRMYSKCSSMVDAQRVFDTTRTPDVTSWSALLLGYAENGNGQAFLELFSEMKAAECVPDSVTCIAALKACTSLAAECGKAYGLSIGRQVHSQIGPRLDLYVQNTLIDMYAKCGSMVDAHLMFDSLQRPNVVSWNALLMGYAESREGLVCLELFSKMKADRCVPNSTTYIAALKACTSMAVCGDSAQGLQLGSAIHLEIGDRMNRFVQSTLIDMYAKCGSMVQARKVFDSIDKPCVVSWNTLLWGYAENGEGVVSLDLFSKMKAAGCTPDSVTYVAALKACTSLAVNGRKAQGLEFGRKIHIEIGHQLGFHVQNTLIYMYGKCGSMVDAHRVFDRIKNPNVVSWTALILGYAENGESHLSLRLFSEMKAGGHVPNAVTYVAALKACISLAVDGGSSGKAEGLERGSEVHMQISEHFSSHVQCTLIDMYAKCGSMTSAHKVFDSIQTPSVVFWNALLCGYAENGEGHICLELFSKMEADGCVPDTVTYVAALKACGLVGALALGRRLHSNISEFTGPVVTCLVEFYAKCGSMAEARAVFGIHPTARDITTWTALLTGYSSCGDTDSVFELFEAMQDAGFKPDGITFSCILLCCSHAGLVRKAVQYLEAMPVQYGVTPNVFHYSCKLDALGRANQLLEAASVLREMPCKPTAVTWGALLSACRKWRNVGIGRMAFESLVEMDKRDVSAFVHMAHIYGSMGMWKEQDWVLEIFRSCDTMQEHTIHQQQILLSPPQHHR